MFIFHGWSATCTYHGPLARYVKLRVAHAPGMPWTFSLQQGVSDPDMHHGTRVTHVPWCMLGSINSGFLWSRWRGKCCRRSRHMRNPQFYVSGKRPMPLIIIKCVCVCVNIPSLLKHDLFIFYDGWHRNIICSIETYISKGTDIFIGFYVPINQNTLMHECRWGFIKTYDQLHFEL